MRTCEFCKKELPLMKTRRTWKEKYLSHRNESKYQCVHCNKITFIKTIL